MCILQAHSFVQILLLHHHTTARSVHLEHDLSKDMYISLEMIYKLGVKRRKVEGMQTYSVTSK